MVKKRPDLGSTRDFLGRFLSVNDSEQWTAVSGQRPVDSGQWSVAG
jgi:hypothetical protein